MQLKEYVKFIDNKAYLRIKVTPRQQKTEFFHVMDDNTLKIRLKAIPEKWKANLELIRYLWEELSIPKAKIEIISGAGDEVKMVRIIVG